MNLHYGNVNQMEAYRQVTGGEKISSILLPIEVVTRVMDSLDTCLQEYATALPEYHVDPDVSSTAASNPMSP